MVRSYPPARRVSLPQDKTNAALWQTIGERIPATSGWRQPTSAKKGTPSMLAPESVIAWIVIGAIAGWLAGLIVKGYGFGLIGNIVVGIVGAAIAGFLAPRLGLHTASTTGT